MVLSKGVTAAAESLHTKVIAKKIVIEKNSTVSDSRNREFDSLSLTVEFFDLRNFSSGVLSFDRDVSKATVQPYTRDFSDFTVLLVP
jgi:hypothetical protein